MHASAHIAATVVNVGFRIDKHADHVRVTACNRSPHILFSLHNTIEARHR